MERQAAVGLAIVRGDVGGVGYAEEMHTVDAAFRAIDGVEVDVVCETVIVETDGAAAAADVGVVAAAVLPRTAAAGMYITTTEMRLGERREWRRGEATWDCLESGDVLAAAAWCEEEVTWTVAGAGVAGGAGAAAADGEEQVSMMYEVS